MYAATLLLHHWILAFLNFDIMDTVMEKQYLEKNLSRISTNGHLKQFLPSHLDIGTIKIADN